MTIFGCPSCGTGLKTGELSKGRCSFCGEIFDADDVVQETLDPHPDEDGIAFDPDLGEFVKFEPDEDEGVIEL